MKRQTVAVDPGHWPGAGCIYPPGAAEPEWTEGAHTLEVADEVLFTLSSAQLHDHLLTVPTHTGQGKPSLSERGAKARELGAGFVVSLHDDAYHSENARGLRIYHLPDDAFAQRIAERVASIAPTALRGAALGGGFKPARIIAATDLPTPDDDWLQRAHNVLHAFHPIPALLIEMGFSTYPPDLAYLRGVLTRSSIVSFVRAVVLEAAAELNKRAS